MAGGMDRGRTGARLWQRPVTSEVASSSRTRHCWVLDPAHRREPGLVISWRRSDGWEALVIHLREDGHGDATVVQEWIPAARLLPA